MDYQKDKVFQAIQYGLNDFHDNSLRAYYRDYEGYLQDKRKVAALFEYHLYIRNGQNGFSSLSGNRKLYSSVNDYIRENNASFNGNYDSKGFDIICIKISFDDSITTIKPYPNWFPGVTQIVIPNESQIVKYSRDIFDSLILFNGEYVVTNSKSIFYNGKNLFFLFQPTEKLYDYFIKDQMYYRLSSNQDINNALRVMINVIKNCSEDAINICIYDQGIRACGATRYDFFYNEMLRDIRFDGYNKLESYQVIKITIYFYEELYNIFSGTNSLKYSLDENYDDNDMFSSLNYGCISIIKNKETPKLKEW